MRVGDVVRCTSLTIHLGGPNDLRETWTTKKKAKYVLLLLAIEDSKTTIRKSGIEKILNGFGFYKKHG